MPRRPRMYLPGYPYHIVQRGNNRELCFFEEENYAEYLNLLIDVLPRYGNALHAYCLMSNHVHLLITPSAADGISSLMRVVASRYATYMNNRYSRSGTLWEGRHKASAVDSEVYLLKCYRYIELNPVAAGMVKRPEEYCWSSYGVNAWGDSNPAITPHPCYEELAAGQAERLKAYRELFAESLSETDLNDFRRAAHYSMPIGSSRFVAQLEEKLGRAIGQAQPGRPRQRGG
ncbi:MAG: transposase [Pseudohongiellaceae bacterium]